MAVPATFGAAGEMEVCWPSRAVLRKKALNHGKGRWPRPCEHERGKRGNDGRSWRSRGLRCWTSDGGCLALRSRRADGGSKPPRGALVNDRRLERRGKRRGCDRVRCGPGR